MIPKLSEQDSVALQAFIEQLLNKDPASGK